VIQRIKDLRSAEAPPWRLWQGRATLVKGVIRPRVEEIRVGVGDGRKS
jgi:hypothetical protein